MLPSEFSADCQGIVVFLREPEKVKRLVNALEALLIPNGFRGATTGSFLEPLPGFRSRSEIGKTCCEM